MRYDTFFSSPVFRDEWDAERQRQLLFVLKAALLISNRKFYKDIDWSKPPQFITPLTLPEWGPDQYACPDLIARVFLKKGEGNKAAFVLLETFSRLDQKLSERVHRYFSRVFLAAENQDVAVFGLFASLDNPTGCGRYKSAFCGSKLSFSFLVEAMADLKEEGLAGLGRKARQ